MSSETIAPLKTISLYYKEGTSDKEYHVEIVGTEVDGYHVNFRFGKRGQKLQCRVKTKAPVDLKTANAVYDSMVNAQLKDGYTEGETGTPYQQTENAARVSGVLPQLLNMIEEDEVQQYIKDDNFIMQEKKDGVRCLIRKRKKVIEGINKKGLIVSLPIPVVESIKAACGEADALLDGEMIGDVYWMFDLLVIGVHSLSDQKYSARLTAIQEWGFLESQTENFKIVPTAVGKASKKAMYALLKKENAEGVVFKHLDSLYKPGKPASGGNHLKFKFVAEATVRVRALNATKDSFQMEMLDKGDWKYVGDCTYYTTKWIPRPGDIVEVRYLYAYPGGALFQPFLKELRDDVDEGDCLISQLKYKQGTQEDDQ